MTSVWSTFSNTLNVGRMESPDGVGYVGDPAWGIDLELSIKVENNTISDAKFTAFGCAATIATSSMVSEMPKGKSIQQALNISDRAIAEAELIIKGAQHLDKQVVLSYAHDLHALLVESDIAQKQSFSQDVCEKNCNRRDESSRGIHFTSAG